MKLDRDICLGAKFDGKEVTELKINNQFIYESEWPDDWNVYTIHIPSPDSVGVHPFPLQLSYTFGNYENNYPLYVDWGGANILEQKSDTLIYITIPQDGTTFNIKTNYELVSGIISSVKGSFISDIISIRKDTTSLKNKFQNYEGKYIRQSVLDKLSHVQSDSMSYMFEGCNKLISIDTSNFDSTNVTDMSYMFSGCYKLETIELGDNFDTSNVTNFYGMFQNCYSLKSLNLSNLKVGYLADTGKMFYKCVDLEYLNLSNASIDYYSYNMVLDTCTSLRELRLDNCGKTTISKIVTSTSLPTGTINGETRKIYCKESRISGVTIPDGWEFVPVD